MHLGYKREIPMQKAIQRRWEINLQTGTLMLMGYLMD
jgi:hypothetical protein